MFSLRQFKNGFVLCTGLFLLNAKADYKREFSNLIEAKRVKYYELIHDTDQLVSKGKIFTALLKLEEAKAIFKDDPGRYYREANYYAAIGSSEEARKHYEKVIRVLPGDFKSLNNLLEISFRDKDWAQCLLDIDRLAKAHPALVSQYPLLALKQLICLDKLNSTKEFEAFRGLLLKHYDHMSDNPLFYYIHVHEYLRTGEQRLADEWMARSWKVFNSVGLYQSWNKALIDTGYLNEYDVVLKRQRRVDYIPFTL